MIDHARREGMIKGLEKAVEVLTEVGLVSFPVRAEIERLKGEADA